MRKIIIIVAGILATGLAMGEDSLRVGRMLNQIKIYGDKLYVIDSGDVDRGAASSISSIDVNSFRLLQQTSFPAHLNLYRSAFESDQVWVSAWATAELLKLDVTRDLSRSSIGAVSAYYAPEASDTGLESVVRMGGRTWIAYSNLKRGNGHGPGKIVVLEEVEGRAEKKQTFITEVPNPKSMIGADGWVFAAAGQYTKDEGQVVAINTHRAPLVGGVKTLSTNENETFYKIFKTGGTPGDLAFDAGSQKLFVCDLEAESNRLWIIDVQSGRIQDVQGQFDTCGAVLFHRGKLYVTNCLGGDLGLNPNHLFVLDATTGQQICAQILKPGSLTKSALIFPNDLEIYGSSLFISYGGYPYVSKLNLDANGKPSGCL